MQINLNVGKFNFKYFDLITNLDINSWRKIRKTIVQKRYSVSCKPENFF